MKKNTQILSVIRYIMVAALLVFIIFLQFDNKISKTPVGDAAAKVAAAADLSNMTPADNRMFKRFYGLNAGDYDGIVLYVPSDSMAAEELLIVKLKDPSQLESVTDAVEKRLQTQLDSFEGYGIEQYKLLTDHVLYGKGNYVFYMVHQNAAAGLQAFEKSL